MGENSNIQWTDHTFNPWTGCNKISPACKNCYAETWGKRFGKEWGPDTPRIVTSKGNWRKPVQWNKVAAAAGTSPRVFCGSLCDVFEDRPDLVEPRARLFELIEATQHLTWLLLTKRAENMVRLAPDGWAGNWPSNVCAMATVENQERANNQIPHLLRVPSIFHGLSIEPLLGPVDLNRFMPHGLYYTTECEHCGWVGSSELCGTSFDGDDINCPECAMSMCGDDTGELDWVIVGGESGNRARPMHPEWLRSLREQCLTAVVPFFFKQWGEWHHEEKQGATRYGRVEIMDEELPMHRVGKNEAGRLLDGHEWNETPWPG